MIGARIAWSGARWRVGRRDTRRALPVAVVGALGTPTLGKSDANAARDGMAGNRPPRPTGHADAGRLAAAVRRAARSDAGPARLARPIPSEGGFEHLPAQSVRRGAGA